MDITGRKGIADEGNAEVMIIGGGQIYDATLPLAHRIYLTEVEGEFVGDAYLPALDLTQWDEVERKKFNANGDTPAYSFVILSKKKYLGHNRPKYL